MQSEGTVAYWAVVTMQAIEDESISVSDVKSPYCSVLVLLCAFGLIACTLRAICILNPLGCLCGPVLL